MVSLVSMRANGHTKNTLEGYTDTVYPAHATQSELLLPCEPTQLSLPQSPLAHVSSVMPPLWHPSQT